MRRFLVLAFSFALAVPASAQARLLVSLSGGVKLVDQDGRSAFQADGAGYDALTLRAASEKGAYGFSVTDENVLDGGFDVRDWNVWYRLFDNRLKVSAGIIRSSDYRTTLPNWYVNTYGGTDLVFERGLMVQAYPAPGLSVGAFLPVGASNQDFLADTLGGADLGASYSIRNVGIVKALVRLGQDYSLDLDGDGDETDAGEAVSDAVMFNAGFTFTAVDGLLASVLARVIRSAEADATFYYAAAGADWDLTPKWALRAEAGFADRPEFSGDREAPLLGVFWDLWGRVRYRITDNLYTHLSLRCDRDGFSSVTGALGYSFDEGLGVSTHLGWDGRLLYDLYVYYAVAF